MVTTLADLKSQRHDSTPVVAARFAYRRFAFKNGRDTRGARNPPMNTHRARHLDQQRFGGLRVWDSEALLWLVELAGAVPCLDEANWDAPHAVHLHLRQGGAVFAMIRTQGDGCLDSKKGHSEHEGQGRARANAHRCGSVERLRGFRGSSEALESCELDEAEVLLHETIRHDSASRATMVMPCRSASSTVCS